MEGVDEWDKAASFVAGAFPRRSTSSLAAVIDIRAVLASITICASIAGCGRSVDTPVPDAAPIAARPDVIITFDGERHACVVARYSEAQGSAIACGAVVSYLKDDLGLPSGSIFDIRTIPDVSEAEVASVSASLKGAGYRFIGGRHVMLTTGPHNDR